MLDKVVAILVSIAHTQHTPRLRHAADESYQKIYLCINGDGNGK